LDLLQSGEEKLEDAGRMGPDTDKEWGYQGLQYIVGVLVFRFAEEMEQDLRTRIDIFERSRRMLAKMFGSGKADKNFPADLVDKTRDIHARMGELIDEWEEQLGESNNAEA
jgi:uncharacterized protein (DUF2225 family)